MERTPRASDRAWAAVGLVLLGVVCATTGFGVVRTQVRSHQHTAALAALHRLEWPRDLQPDASGCGSYDLCLRTPSRTRDACRAAGSTVGGDASTSADQRFTWYAWGTVDRVPVLVTCWTDPSDGPPPVTRVGVRLLR